jgi:hypothetical protein
MARARVLTILVVAAGCGGEADETEPFEIVPIGAPTSMTIGPAGGRLASGDGHLTLEIPPGALAADTTIAIQELEITDGWGWSLGPAGTTFAMPVTARLAFSFAEVGQPTVTLAGDELTTVMPDLEAAHLPVTGPAEQVILTTYWADGSPTLAYEGTLSHFSELVVTKKERITYVHPSQVNPGAEFTVRATRELSDFVETEVQLSCPDRDPRWRNVQASVRTTIVDLIRTSNASFTATGLTTPIDGGGLLAGFQGNYVCNRTGNGPVVTSKVTLEREGGAPWPRDCDPWMFTRESSVLLPITCIATCTASDPTEMAGLPDGDPSLDLVCVDTGVQTVSGGETMPWMRVLFAGPWLPPDYYSWFSRVTVRNAAGAILGTFVREHHAGQDTTMFTGALDSPLSYVFYSARGYNLMLPRGLAIASAVVESGVMKTMTSPVIQDVTQVPAFDTSERALY